MLVSDLLDRQIEISNRARAIDTLLHVLSEQGKHNTKLYEKLSHELIALFNERQDIIAILEEKWYKIYHHI